MACPFETRSPLVPLIDIYRVGFTNDDAPFRRKILRSLSVGKRSTVGNMVASGTMAIEAALIGRCESVWVPPRSAARDRMELFSSYANAQALAVSRYEVVGHCPRNRSRQCNTMQGARASCSPRSPRFPIELKVCRSPNTSGMLTRLRRGGGHVLSRHHLHSAHAALCCSGIEGQIATVVSLHSASRATRRRSCALPHHPNASRTRRARCHRR